MPGFGSYFKQQRQVKQPVVDQRFDFRGGRNSAITSDLLNPNELVDCTNARLDFSYGGFTKRQGTQRIHQTAIATGILGVTQWDGPSGKQVVVAGNDGKLYFRNGFTYSTGFTQVTPGTLFSTTLPAFFAPFRAASSGAPLVLYIASGGNLYSWDGTATLTKLTGTNSAPAADFLVAYHTRMFAHDINFKKHVFWSIIGDATDFRTGTAAQGGSALVNVLNGEAINTFDVIGSSLLMGSKNAISRFTGYSSADIVIAQDTEGISSEVGPIGSQAILRFENVAALLSERGPYAVTETGVQPIGEQVFNEFTSSAYSGASTLSLTVANLPNSVIAYHRGRKELWFFIPLGGSGNVAAMVQSTRLQAWMGPFTFPFSVTCASTYFDTNGNPNIIAGCSDGFVRLMDVSSGLDDLLFDGSGGSGYNMFVEIPVIHFGMPGIQKAVRRAKVQASSTSGLNVGINLSEGTGFIYTVVPTTTALTDLRVDLPEAIAKRFSLQFAHGPFVGGGFTNFPTVNGYSLFGHNMNRI